MLTKVLVTCTAAGALAIGYTISRTTMPSADPPPLSLYFAGNPMVWLETGGQIQARATWNTPDKFIHLTWIHISSRAKAKLDYAVSYWPTCMYSVSPGRMLVAGKDRLGLTVLYDVGYSMPLPIVDPGTGEVSLQPGLVTSVDLVARFNSPGKDMIRWIVPNLADPENAILVSFFDSNDIYSIDLNTGTSILRVSANPGGDLLVSELGFTFESVSVYHHNTDGYFYVLRHPYGNKAGLLLKDADYDGTLDSSLYLVGNTWSNLGYQDPDNFQY